MTNSDERAGDLAGYSDLLARLEDRVRQTQFRAVRAASTEVMRLYWSIGSAPSTFDSELNPVESDLARQLVKDPYVFEQLAMVNTRLERDVEQALVDRLQDALMGFSRGMALVGRQFHLPLGDGEEFIIDLLLFHVEQLRYVAVQLKVGSSLPAHIRQRGPTSPRSSVSCAAATSTRPPSGSCCAPEKAGRRSSTHWPQPPHHWPLPRTRRVLLGVLCHEYRLEWQ
ncbi:PDDEXK nuclease domain-containing protein [Sanguibacter antarcticus]|uniref:PDDEXK nuclease domain-containing protein n=1 Tax=Sanguibacter antarcticus TaxID=372484 RepID=UPI001FE2690D|nr:PDDEXK nuclease domain-containing protein [Sanguibacter antarcticus]